MERITSRSNALVQRARRLSADPAVRKQEHALVAEGVRLLEEARDAGVRAEQIFHSPRLVVTERGRALLQDLRRASAPLIETTDIVLESISDAETSQGIVGVLASPTLSEIPTMPGNARSGGEFWVIAWGLQDPGNVGTLLRTAHAAGAGVFITLAGTADPTSPKAVRASAGSVFRLPLVRGLAPDAILDTAASRGVRLHGTDPRSGNAYETPTYAGSIGFVFGREGEGVPPAVIERLHDTVTIPMEGGVESLNVAAAAAIVLFEASRQRRTTTR